MVTVAIQLPAWGERGIFHTPLNKIYTPHPTAVKRRPMAALDEHYNPTWYGDRGNSTSGLGGRGIFHTPSNKIYTPHPTAAKRRPMAALDEHYNPTWYGDRGNSTSGLGGRGIFHTPLNKIYTPHPTAAKRRPMAALDEHYNPTWYGDDRWQFNFRLGGRGEYFLPPRIKSTPLTPQRPNVGQWRPSTSTTIRHGMVTVAIQLPAWGAEGNISYPLE
jgi:hypothetical protein